MRASVFLAGKRDCRRHSTTSFRENIVVAEKRYQMLEVLSFCDQAPVVQTLDSAIHRINHYPADKYYASQLRYPLDSDLSGG